MHILHAITYYKPHVSGMAVYAERLCRALAARGHHVTLLTAQLNAAAPTRAVVDGVHVERAPTVAQVGKGIIAPAMLRRAWRLLASADMLHIHLPHFDGPALALLARLRGVPLVVTHHCDVVLPPGLQNTVAQRTVALLGRLTLRQADAVVTSSADYAQHSPQLRHYLSSTHRVIPPPVDPPRCTPEDVRRFRKAHHLPGRPVIGLVGRVSAEKGLDVFMDALPAIVAAEPDVCVLHAGPGSGVPGETGTLDIFKQRLNSAPAPVSLLGTVADRTLAAFYHAVDLLVVPSINRTESFGLAQAEALLCGTPVVASDLPGMRVPVTRSGRGALFEAGNPAALARAVVKEIEANKRSVEYLPALTPSDIGVCSSPASALTHAQLYQSVLEERH